MSEDQEQHLDFKRGFMEEHERQIYEDLIKQKQRDQRLKIQQKLQESMNLRKKEAFLFNIKKEVEEIIDEDQGDHEKDLHNDIILQKYYHPVEAFMLDDFHYFYEDFSEKVLEIIENMEGKNSEEYEGLKKILNMMTEKIKAIKDEN